MLPNRRCSSNPGVVGICGKSFGLIGISPDSIGDMGFFGTGCTSMVARVDNGGLDSGLFTMTGVAEFADFLFEKALGLFGRSDAFVALFVNLYGSDGPSE